MKTQGGLVVGRLVAAAALCASLAAMAACGSSTGVLVEVTRDDSVPAGVDRLVFYVGTDAIRGFGGRFADEKPTSDADVSGRDLAQDPYRLMVTPGSDPGASILVAVLAKRGDETVGFGSLDRPVGFVDGKVTQWTVTLHADRPDGLDVTDLGCLTWVDPDGNRVTIGQPGDLDCDGYGADDCNDLDPTVNPGATEVCGNDVDDDCNGMVDENVDNDGDGVTNCEGDCNDRDRMVRPGADEICDGVDNDCNDLCDDGLDPDGDRFTSCGSEIVEGGSQCLFDPDTLTDCSPQDQHTFPGAAEMCDGADNDCNGVCDDDPALDPDLDEYSACGSILGECGMAPEYVDCAPDDPSVVPGATELCDGRDDDCDGALLQVGACFADSLQDGVCELGQRTCGEQAGSDVSWTGACQAGGSPVDQAPAAACMAYTDCDAAGDPDPYTCAIKNSNVPTTDCVASFEVGTGLQCPQHEVALPTGGLDNCSWTVVGGIEQGDFQIGLRPAIDPTTGIQPTLDVCQAVLQVNSTVKGPPSEITVLLRRQDTDTTATYMAVHVAPDHAATCTPPDGLSCNGLSAPAPAPGP